MAAFTLKVKWIRVFQNLGAARSAFDRQKKAAGPEDSARWELIARKADAERTTNVEAMDVYDVDRSPRTSPPLYRYTYSYFSSSAVPTRASIQTALMTEETSAKSATLGRVGWIAFGLKIEEKK